MPDPEIFRDLRDRLFGGDLAQLVPASGPPAPSTAAPEILGVAMEVGIDRGTYLVFGLRDGTASLYLSTGGGAIGGGGHPHINAAAKRLVETAQRFAHDLPFVSDHPLPAKDRVRFSIFTAGGVQAAEEDHSALAEGRGPLGPLFSAAHEIIAGFRLLEQPEFRDESKYVNCLLTALARGKAASATVTEGRPPPDPATLTGNEQDLEWIARTGFALDQLSAAKIIERILQLTRFPWLALRKREGRIEVKLAPLEGDVLTDVAFHVRRRRSAGRVEIEVIPIRGGQ